MVSCCSIWTKNVGVLGIALITHLLFIICDQPFACAICGLLAGFSGATENARLELSAPSKMQGWKMQDWNLTAPIQKGTHNCEIPAISIITLNKLLSDLFLR